MFHELQTLSNSNHPTIQNVKAIIAPFKRKEQKEREEGKKGRGKKKGRERKNDIKRFLIRVSFHVRTTLLLFPSFWKRSKEKRSFPSRIDHRKTRSNFFKNPFEFLPRCFSVSFDYTEKTSFPPSPSPPFPSLSPQHTDFSSMNGSSLSLSLSLSSTFFLHIVIAQTCRLWRPLSRIRGARVSRHRSSLKLSHSSN